MSPPKRGGVLLGRCGGDGKCQGARLVILSLARVGRG